MHDHFRATKETIIFLKETLIIEWECLKQARFSGWEEKVQ